VPIDDIRTVCFVGAGTMGCFNALMAALGGYDVIVYDLKQDSLDQVHGRQQEIADLLVANGLIPAESVPDALGRVQTTPDLTIATAEADLVSESVFERLDLKRQIHAQLDQVCPPATILTTNTSTLLISDIEDVVARGDRFAALHSHLGASLYDIVGGPRTSSTTIDILQRYVRSIGGEPLVLKKEHPGYVLNAMLGPLLTAAMVLVAEGLCTIEQVDRAWMLQRRAPMGPFGIIDLFGLDLICDSWAHRQHDGDDLDLKQKILAFLEPYRASGELGMKSGKGFYNYPEPAYAAADFLQDHDDLRLPQFVLTKSLLQDAVLLAAGGIAEPAVIDRAWMVATTLDQGPFAILDELGIDEFRGMLDSPQNRLTTEDSAKISAYLQQYVAGKG
jgi:3-hydroxybutyryl-CoA dehydrogenase